MSTSYRQEWVDYAKAIGIILVVYGHVAPGIYNAGLITNDVNYFLVQKFIYSFHMPLFFFLSGLFFWDSLIKRGSKHLIGSKVDTIVYAYILWSLLQGFSEIILAQYVTDPPSIKYVLSLLWQPRQQFWYLYALFMIFLLYSIVFYTTNKTYIFPTFLITILLYLFREKIPGGGFYLTWVTEYSPYFILGVLVTNYSLLNYLKKPVVFYLILVLCIVTHGINLYSVPTGLYGQKIISFVVSSTSIALVVIFSLQLTKHNIRWLLYLGSASMAIYVMHTFATSGTRILLTKIFNIYDSFTHLTMGTLLGLAAPCLAYFIKQKFKIPFIFSAPISSIFQKNK